MNKKLRAARYKHDPALIEDKQISISARSHSSGAAAIGLKKISLSKSLQNLFHRKHSYTIKQGNFKKGKKLFESINDADGVNMESAHFRRSGKARVWSVRNSFSKSPVEFVPRELLKFGSPTKVRKKNKRNRTCSFAFDVLHSFNDFFLASEENLTIKQNKNNSSELKCSHDQTNLDTQSDHSDVEHCGSFDETLDRSRLSSFGSSACYSDAAGCCCSLSTCSYCNLDRSDSIAMETDVTTSYWDLRLPTESLFRRSGPNCRRYSFSVLTEHQTVFGSPEMRSYLAKRRSSEQPSVYTGLNRNNYNMCWQDKFLHALNIKDCNSKEIKNFTEIVGEQNYIDKDKKTKIAIDIPKVHRSNSASGETRKAKGINQSHISEEGESLDRRHMQRSWSVDSSYNRRLFHSRERKTSKSSTCQFAFSDIESSEESESSPDPKESSPEGRQQSSCNDTSSLSASSVSGSSSNERNTPDTSKRKILNISVSSIKDLSVNMADDFDVESINLEEKSYVSLKKEIVFKDSEIDIKTAYNNLKYIDKTEERGTELERCSDIQNLEISKKLTNILHEVEESSTDVIDSVSVKNLELNHDNASVEDDIIAQVALAANRYQNDEFARDSENKNSKVVAEEFPQNGFGTDIDFFFQKQYEMKELCLDIFFSEKDITDCRCQKKDVDENRCEQYEMEELCLDILFSERDMKDGGCKKIVTDEYRCDPLSLSANNFQETEQFFEKDKEKPDKVGKDEKELTNFNENICQVVESAKTSNCNENEDDKPTEVGICTSDFDVGNYSNDHNGMIENDTEIDGALNFFDSVLHDELRTDKELGEEKKEKEQFEVAVFKADSNDSYDFFRATDESIEDECKKRLSEDINGISEQIDFEKRPYRTCTENVQGVQVKNAENFEHINQNSKVFDMTGESRKVGHLDEHINNNTDLYKRSLEEILFNSGKMGSSLHGVKIVDDVDGVFEAMNREISKGENKDKDMMVVFIVGGELKVIRRSGTQLNGSHGDSRQKDIPSMTRKESPHQNGSRDYMFTRSVQDINRGRPKSAIIVTRSQSFNGMANQQVVMGGRRESPQAIVLGESFRHHRAAPPMQVPRATPGSRGAVGFSFKKSPKVPKVPRPNRALLMFQSVKRGIREFIEATKEDIDQLQHRETDQTSTAQGKLHEADKQIKSAERYLKRLEFHLAKLDELHEYYLLQQQLREGVRTMHRAYVTSPGNQTHSLSNVKYGYKECTQTMCNIEAQLEAMMGTFNCKLKGMAGFARLCPGDVFEVTVRHGTQKWKTKGRIEKTGNQKWDIPEFNFKAVVGDIFNIKGLEVRAFKSVLLGQKSCETKDLFSANPQLMTVSINVNGSLKLSIVITWNPLDGVEESFNFLETPQRAQGTPRRRPVSVIALNGQYDAEPGVDRQHPTPVTIQQTKDDNFILRTNPLPSHHVNNVTSYHGLDSPHVNARHSEQHMPDAYRQAGPLYTQTSHHIQAGFHSSPAFPVFGESDSDKPLSHPPTQNSAFSNSLPTVMGHLHFPSVSSHNVVSAKEEEENSVLNIEDVLHTLSSSLEDYHGQYTELQKLEDLVKFAHKLIRKQFRSSSRSSSISVSIESALEAFDFLDTEEAFEEPRSPTDNVKATFDDMLCSPESTAKTGDSGIESLAQRLSEDTQLGSSLGSSPVPPSTGNEEVDQCLLYHLTYCERLLENLGAFGPLKCREIYALDKLQKQCTIVENLLKLAKSGPHIDLHNVMSTICEDKALREFWVKCTDQNSLNIHPDRLLNMFEQKYSSVIADRHMIDPGKVCQHVITRVLDIPDYEAERGRSWFILTLHQFMLYFNEEGGLKHIENVAEEMKLVEKLTSGNPDAVIKAILTLRDTLPSSPCLKVIGMLLVTMDKEVEQCTLSYLNLIQRKKANREKALITFVEGLEDRTPEIRSGACAALAILEASESLDLLVYLWQSDSSLMVQKCAKEALLALGDEGRKAFEDAQLSKHGFQGVQVHK